MDMLEQWHYRTGEHTGGGKATGISTERIIFEVRIGD
jgi:hypothetical protein